MILCLPRLAWNLALDLLLGPADDTPYVSVTRPR